MVAHKLRPTRSVLRLYGLEKLRHPARIVARIVECSGTKQIGFFFRAARHLQKAQARGHSNALLCQRSRRAAKEHTRRHLPQSRNQSDLLLLNRITNRMLQNNVRNLVRHHARQLRFRGGRLNRSQVYENGSTRQRERVDLRHIRHVKVVWPLVARRLRHEPPPSSCMYFMTDIKPENPALGLNPLLGLFARCICSSGG